MSREIRISLAPKPKERKEKVQLSMIARDVVITGVPDNHELEYLAVDNSRNCGPFFIVVHRPKRDWGYKDFRLHMGYANQLEEAEVKDVERFRDGGTTTIDYVWQGVEGKLVFPSSRFPGKQPTNSLAGEAPLTLLPRE